MENKVREQKAGKHTPLKAKEDSQEIEKKIGVGGIWALIKINRKKYFPLYCCRACQKLNGSSPRAPIVTFSSLWLRKEKVQAGVVPNCNDNEGYFRHFSWLYINHHQTKKLG